MCPLNYRKVLFRYYTAVLSFDRFLVGATITSITNGNWSGGDIVPEIILEEGTSSCSNITVVTFYSKEICA